MNEDKATQTVSQFIENKNINITGKNLIFENPVKDSMITTNADIIIHGGLINSKIKTSAGILTVFGNIENSEIEIFGDLRAHKIESSKIKSTYGACYVEESIDQSNIQAMSVIQLSNKKGEIHNSQLSCAIEIDSKLVGQFNENKISVLELIPRKKKDLFEMFFVFKQKLKAKEQKLSSLQRYIKVFTLIKDKINSLPKDKKVELINKVQEYKELKKVISQIQQEKARLFLDNEEDDKYNRGILIRESIYPPAKIIIDGRELELKTSEHEVGFYKSGIIISGKIEKIFNKRKSIQNLPHGK